MPLDILLVDDNRDAAELLEELLSMEGHTTRTAGTAIQALEVMRSRPARVLIVDQNLPDMKGSELVPLLRAVAADHGAGACFAIAVTGMSEGDRTGPDMAPFDQVLGKPLDFDEFDTVLARCASALESSPAA